MVTLLPAAGVAGARSAILRVIGRELWIVVASSIRTCHLPPTLIFSHFSLQQARSNPEPIQQLHSPFVERHEGLAIQPTTVERNNSCQTSETCAAGLRLGKSSSLPSEDRAGNTRQSWPCSAPGTLQAREQDRRGLVLCHAGGEPGAWSPAFLPVSRSQLRRCHGTSRSRQRRESRLAGRKPPARVY